MEKVEQFLTGTDPKAGSLLCNWKNREGRKVVAIEVVAFAVAAL